MFDFIKFLEILFKMEAKTSTEGADRAANKMAWAVFVLFACIGAAIVLWRIAPNGFF